MAIPLLIIGAAAYGIKKGINAKDNFERAEDIADKAKSAFNKLSMILEEEREATNSALKELGELKKSVFVDQFKYLVDFTKKLNKESSAKLNDFEEYISFHDVEEMEMLVDIGLSKEELGSVALKGFSATAGASLMSAIVPLGSVLAPAMAVGGFVMASKAEEAVTEAEKYKAEVDIRLEEMEKDRVFLKGVRSHGAEMYNVISEAVKRFEEVKTSDVNNENLIKLMFSMGHSIKELIKIPIVDENNNLVEDIKVIYSGKLVYKGVA